MGYYYYSIFKTVTYVYLNVREKGLGDVRRYCHSSDIGEQNSSV